MKGCIGSLLLVFGLFCAFTVGFLALGSGGGLILMGVAVMAVHRHARKPRAKHGWMRSR